MLTRTEHLISPPVFAKVHDVSSLCFSICTLHSCALCADAVVFYIISLLLSNNRKLNNNVKL